MYAIKDNNGNIIDTSFEQHNEQWIKLSEEEEKNILYSEKKYFPFSVEPELYELKFWFSDTYTYKEQKYRRLQMLGLKDDDGASATEKLVNLYIEAEKKRKRIQELERLLGENL